MTWQQFLTEEVLGECYHEGHMPINCGYRCVKCGDTYVANRTFTTDADMMALFRKMVDESQLHGADSFLDWADTVWDKAGMKIILDDDENFISWLFYDPERFCNLVAEWLEVKK